MFVDHTQSKIELERNGRFRNIKLVDRGLWERHKKKVMMEIRKQKDEKTRQTEKRTK